MWRRPSEVPLKSEQNRAVRMAPTGTFTFTVSWGCSWGMAEAELWTDEDFAPSASVMGTNVDASGGTAAPASWRRVSGSGPMRLCRLFAARR